MEPSSACTVQEMASSHIQPYIYSSKEQRWQHNMAEQLDSAAQHMAVPAYGIAKYFPITIQTPNNIS